MLLFKVFFAWKFIKIIFVYFLKFILISAHQNNLKTHKKNLKLICFLKVQLDRNVKHYLDHIKATTTQFNFKYELDKKLGQEIFLYYFHPHIFFL